MAQLALTWSSVGKEGDALRLGSGSPAVAVALGPWSIFVWCLQRHGGVRFTVVV